MIYDTFLFAGEAEMMELRLRTLAPVVDRFVGIACGRTYQGQPVNRTAVEGAFNLALRRARVERPISLHWFEPSLVLRKVRSNLERSPDERGPAGSEWFMHIERQHRRAVRGIFHRQVTNDPDAVVLMSDVDEIPCPKIVQSYGSYVRQRPDTYVCQQRFHSTALNLLHPQGAWYGTIISLNADLYAHRQREARGTIQGMTGEGIRVIPWGGWHFSWFGTDEQRALKLETFSHAELLGVFDPIEGRRLGQHANGERLIPITLEESYRLDWPDPILDGSFEIPRSWMMEGAWD